MRSFCRAARHPPPMTQTRTFLLIAWLVVAFLLWDAWQKDYNRPAVAPAQTAGVDALIPSAADPGALPSAGEIPAPSVSGELPETDTQVPAEATVVLANDVLRLTL